MACMSPGGGRRAGMMARAAVLLLMLPVALPGAANIENAGATLTIDEAVALALDNNFSLRNARTRIRERSGVLTHAQRPVPANPRLELKTGYRTRPGSDSVDIGIRVAQEFWIGGQGRLQAAAAKNRLNAAEADYAFLATAVAARARRAFLNVLWAREARTTARRTLRFARQLEGYAKQRLEVGESTRLDLNTARLGTAQAHNAVQKAEAALERARIGLSRVLSIDSAELPAIEGQLALEPVDLADRDQLVKRAARRRQDIAAAAQRVAAAREDLELSRRQAIPNLTVFGYVEREGGEDTIPGIGVSLPLPLLHQYRGETEQAAAQLEQRQLSRDELLLDIRHELALAMADYRAARDRIQIVSDQMLEAAEANVGLVQEAFRAGEVGSAALAMAQNNLLDVRDEYLQALQDLIRAGSELERVTGGLVFLAGSPGNKTSATSTGEPRE